MANIREQLRPLILETKQAEVARRCRSAGHPQITSQRINDWLGGRRDMYGERIEAIADAVGVGLVAKNLPKHKR